MKNIKSEKIKGYKFIKSEHGVEEYRLVSNDLRVLTKEVHFAPIVTLNVTYHVGSRNEALGHTGATHFLEHLLFKGTKKYPGKDLTKILEGEGARVNATTWFDRTNYYETMPSEILSKAIDIEADRMRNAAFTEYDKKMEMKVVRNEFERGENNPLEILDKDIWATAYRVHPYQYSTIGLREDVENVSADKLREFYDIFYWPNNATVTVVGDIRKKEILETIKNKFGKLPKSKRVIPEMKTKEPKQEGARKTTVKRKGETNIIGLAHKIPRGLHKDTYAIQILSEVLAGGKSSRLHKALVDNGLASEVSIFNYPFHDESILISYVYLTAKTSHQVVEKIILKEYEKIKKDGISEKELIKAKERLKTDRAFMEDGSYAISSVINEGIALGDWAFYLNFNNKMESVSKEDVKRVAGEYLCDDRSTTGYFLGTDNNQ